MAKVKFLRSCSVAGRSYAAGDEADLNEADTHTVVTVTRKAQYVNAQDDPSVTAEPTPNPSIIPDLQRSLDPKIRQLVTQGIETAVKAHEEEIRRPTPPDGIVRDADGNPAYPDHPGIHDADLARRSAEDRARDPGNLHLDPTKGPNRTVDAREPHVLTRDPSAPSRTGASAPSRGTPGTSPAPAGSPEAAVKHQTSSSSASGSHPSGGRK